MGQERQYRGTDHTRLAFDLLKTRISDPSPMGYMTMAKRNAELGLNPQDALGQDVMHTMFAAVGLAATFAQALANATGRTLEDVVADHATMFELETPDELQRGSIQDSLNKKDD